MIPPGPDDTLELPVVETTAAPERRTLLVVDDSVDAQELFRIHLQRSGFEVLSAHNGQDALALLNGAHLPSLIIVDLLMPVMDGMELIESLRADARLAELPVLVVSAVDVPRGARVPHTRYIRKPFRNADLISNIEELVNAPVRPDP